VAGGYTLQQENKAPFVTRTGICNVDRHRKYALEKSSRPPGSVGLDDGVDSKLPSLETALNSPLGRKMPRMMRTIATKRVSGETPEQIGRAIGIGRELVNDYLRHVVSTLHCQPLPLHSVEVENATNVTKPLPTSEGELSSQELMIEARCESCGKNIEGDEERVLAAAMALNYGRKDEWLDYEVRLHVGKALHYCLECARTTEELRIPNPWFVSEEQRRAATKWLEERKVEQVAEAAKRDGILVKALAEETCAPLIPPCQQDLTAVT
jgi:hypothetical protein